MLLLPANEAAVAKMKETSIVHIRTDVWKRPNELLDPRNEILAAVFDADALFPPPYYCTPTWLEILKTLGLEGTLTAELLCRCARRIEASFPCANSAPVIGKAVLLLRHMIENISRFYSQSFCAELTLIRFVPAWRASAHGRPESADAEDYSQCTLVLFSEAALPRDQYLVWTVQPILLDRAVRAPLPHRHRGSAHRCHICTGTGLTPATSAPGLRV
jgi:hypothetical protein